MQFTTDFLPLAVEDIPGFAAERQADGWRFVQILAVRTDAGADLVYSFMKDGRLENHLVEGVSKDTVVPSITDRFLAAFVFENEIHDLFGIRIEGIAIDFGGNFYQVAQKEPMTILSPEQVAAREKAAKAAAAKREKADKIGRAAAAQAAYMAANPESGAKETHADVVPEADPDLETKFASMDPEKVARVKAAMAAKAKKAAEQAAIKEAEREEKIAKMDPEKAARVKAAREAKAARKAAESAPAEGTFNIEADAELEAKLAQLDPERATKVREALEAKARREAEKKGE